MARPVCPNGHRPDYFLARYPVEVDDGDGHFDIIPSTDAVRLDKDGYCTNLWEDGTAGVPYEAAHAAESDAADVFCPICYDEVTWNHD